MVKSQYTSHYISFASVLENMEADLESLFNWFLSLTHNK